MFVSGREAINVRQVAARGITRVSWIRMIGERIFLFEAGSDFTGDWVSVTVHSPLAHGSDRYTETRTFERQLA